jgi:hypothetical protein
MPRKPMRQNQTRSKQIRPAPAAETSESEDSPQSSDVIPTLESPSEDEPTTVVQQKKRVRASKKEIPDFKWTEEAELRLAELVKESPQLYDKRQKEWLNVAAKNSRWDRVGEQLEPPATGPQCRKFYENMRTRLGKLLKKEKKSGAGQPQRSAREHQIMQTWRFLTQHIVRGETTPSEKFVPVTISDDDDDDEEIPRSQASSTTGKSTGKGMLPTPTTDKASKPAESGVSQNDLSEAVKQVRILMSTFRLYSSKIYCS